jgi:hypothetical protein
MAVDCFEVEILESCSESADAAVDLVTESHGIYCAVSVVIRQLIHEMAWLE